MKGWCCVCLGLGGGVVVGCDGGSVVVVVVNFLRGSRWRRDCWF